MKKLLWGNIFFIIFQCVFLTGCNSVKLKVDSSDKAILPDRIYSYNVNAHGSFWNLSNTSIQKHVLKVNVTPSGNNSPKEFAVRNGTDFIGSKKNQSVTYHFTYFDSVLAVLSLGFYVPFRIEYIPAKYNTGDN